MRKNITFIVGPALGHVARVLSVADAMARMSKCKITLLSPDIRSFLKELANKEYDTRLIPVKGPENMEIQFGQGLEDYFSKNQPDLIVFDLNPVLWITTTNFPEIPQAYITNVFITKHARKLTDQMTSSHQNTGEINARRKAVGLDPIVETKDLYERDLVLLADPGFIIELYGRLPGHYFPAMPCSWDTSNETLPPELSEVKNALLLSLGSTGKVHLLEETIARLLERMEFDAVILVGSEAQKEGAWDHYITHRYNWLPLTQFLSKTKLAVTHGGTGSSYQALQAGTPLICCPCHTNNLILALLLEELGLGICIDNKGDLGKLDNLDLNAMQNAAQKAANKTEGSLGAELMASRLLELADRNSKGIFARLRNSLSRIMRLTG